MTWDQIVQDYKDAGGPWPFKKQEVVEWALSRHRWKPSPADIRRMCAESLADAMRDASFTDEEGREVRRMLPARTTRGGEQGTFWDDVRTAPIGHLRMGVAQRRSGIVAETFHLYKIVRYSNEHRGPAEQIELVLDFTNDVREMEEPVAPRKRGAVGATPSSNEPAPQPPQPPRAAPESTARPVTSLPAYRRSARARPR